MPRPQFTLRALLVAMLVVGAFFGGLELGRRTAVSERNSLEGDRRFLWEAIFALSKDNAKLIEELKGHGIKVPELEVENPEASVEFDRLRKAAAK